MVLSPELGLLEEWIERGLLSNVEEIRAYQAEAARNRNLSARNCRMTRPVSA